MGGICDKVLKHDFIMRLLRKNENREMHKYGGVINGCKGTKRIYHIRMYRM